jgi:hypothetical protein
MDRIAHQPRRIVAILIPAGDAKETLAQQLTHTVLDLALLAPIDQLLTQSSAQPQCRIARLQQDRSAIGAAISFVELHPQGLGKQLGKQDGLSCDIVAHAKASDVTEVLVVKPFLSQMGLLSFRNSRPFANSSG